MGVKRSNNRAQIACRRPQHRTHQGKTKRVVLFARVTHTGTVKGQGMDILKRSRLELLALITGQRRPAERFPGIQCPNSDRTAGVDNIQRDRTGD